MYNFFLQNEGKMERAKRMKEDSLLLLRGFDSVSNSLNYLAISIISPGIRSQSSMLFDLTTTLDQIRQG